MVFAIHHHISSKMVVTVMASSTLLVGMAEKSNWALATPENAANIAQATVVPTSSIQQETLYLNNDRAYSYHLEVEQGITVNGQYFPPGAEIQGQYVPAEGGLRYEANAVVIDGRSYPFSATSRVITDIKDPRDTNAGAIAADAGIGAAGGLILGEILGDGDLGSIVGGAAAGAAVGNVTADRVVVVEPDQSIDLYL